MRILVLFGPDSYGGSFVIAEKIARVYVNHGHQVLMVVKDPYSIELYKQQGYDVVSIDSMERQIKLFKDIISSYKLMRLYKKYDCDVIHSHTSKGGFYSRLSKLFSKNIKVIHTVHGYYKPQNKIKKSLFYFVERMLLPLGDVTTYVSYEDYKNTSSHSSTLAYIPNGVDTTNFNNDRDFNSDLFQIIISARIVWEKGYREIIELVKNFEYYNIHFNVVGNGANETEVKRILSKYNNVTFHGFVSDIKNVLYKSHLNLLPSYREGLSLSILEAMASGIPTIAYNIRGNRELIDDGKNGYLCEIYDVKGLEDKIKFYYNNRKVCEIHGEKAYAKARKKYNSESIDKLYIKVLKKISVDV